MSNTTRPMNYSYYNTCDKRSQFHPDNIALLDEFIDYCISQNKSQETIKQYKNKIEVFFVWLLDERDNKSFLTLTKKDIMAWQGDKVKQHKSSSNIRQTRAALSSLSKYIEDVCDEYPNFKNIINKIPAPGTEYIRKKTYLSGEEIELIKQELIKREDWQLVVYLCLTYDSASRKSEIWQTLKNIDFKKRETNIVKGKGKKSFTMPFSKETSEYIKKWLEIRGKDDCEHLFITKTRDGKIRPIRKDATNVWCEYFSQILNELTGKEVKIYPHCFKSSRLSNLYHDKKVSLEIVQKFGHHSSAMTTLNNYIEERQSDVNNSIFNEGDE